MNTMKQKSLSAVKSQVLLFLTSHMRQNTVPSHDLTHTNIHIHSPPLIIVYNDLPLTSGISPSQLIFKPTSKSQHIAHHQRKGEGESTH